jgi:hypothetical protein
MQPQAGTDLEASLTSARKSKGEIILSSLLANLHAFAGWRPEVLAEADRTNCRFDCGQVYGLCGRRALAPEFARNREAALKHQYVTL